jgi:hypothetical protein
MTARRRRFPRGPRCATSAALLCVIVRVASIEFQPSFWGIDATFGVGSRPLPLTPTEHVQTEMSAASSSGAATHRALATRDDGSRYAVIWGFEPPQGLVKVKRAVDVPSG